jgi:hypothetical protein
MHWSSIVIQILVNDHTNYIISIRAKYEQVSRPPSTSLLATSCDNLDSYTLVEREGLQEMDRAVTTCCLPPQRWKGTMHSPICPYLWQNLLSHMAHLFLPLSFRLLIATHECPTTLKVCRVPSGNLNHPRFVFRAGSITVALEDYNSDT